MRAGNAPRNKCRMPGLFGLEKVAAGKQIVFQDPPLSRRQASFAMLSGRLRSQQELVQEDSQLPTVTTGAWVCKPLPTEERNEANLVQQSIEAASCRRVPALPWFFGAVTKKPGRTMEDPT